jgi:hypothetical protein
MRGRANQSLHFFCECVAHFGNNASSWDMNRPLTLPKIHKICAPLRSFGSKSGLVIATLLLFAGCKQPGETAIAAAEEEPVLMCGDDGRLSGKFYGAVETTLDWGRNDLECAGMPRPEGRGARLRFAGNSGPDAPRLAIIIAIPELTRDAEGVELGSNVTLIEEGSGRFFSTPDLKNCLTDIATVRAIDESGDRYSVTGALYCVAPLPELNGDSSVSIPELRFSGLLDWSAS